MRRSFDLRVLIIILLVERVLTTPHPAQALSAACAFINGLVHTNITADIILLPLEAGEQVTFTLSNPTNGATSAELQVPNGGPVVASTTVPGVLSYVPPAATPSMRLQILGGSSAGADVSVACGVSSGSGKAFAGPGIPDGFVLRSIVCDTPVYNKPNGVPLGTGEHITAGQTWFFNPVSPAPGWEEGSSRGFTTAMFRRIV
jgi:hypothetical protein